MEQDPFLQEKNLKSKNGNFLEKKLSPVVYFHTGSHHESLVSKQEKTELMKIRRVIREWRV
jgi:hypothetical protein